MIKAVIFDLDGVIVSTDELHYQAWKHIATLENIYFDHKINHRLRGISRMESLEIILKKADKKYTNQEKIDMANIKNNHYGDLLKQLSSKDVLPHVKIVLDSLKQKGIKIAIGSSSRNAKAILEQIELMDEFDAIADGHDAKHSKPAPDVFLMAAEKLGIEPEYCAVVEDAIAGIEAAKAASMIAIAVSDAKHSELADYKFDDLRAILSLI